MTSKRLATFFLAAVSALLMALPFAPAVSAAQNARASVRVVVAPDGSGDFRTIQQAIDHAPPEGDGRLIIAIQPGIYHERLTVPQDRARTTFVGLGKDPASTVVTYSMSAAAAGGTFFSSTVDVEASDFEASNLTFENSFGPGSQAVALSIHSDRAILRRCRLIGWQDTLYAASGRQYYDHCYIEGAIDFIFGNARAIFDHCEIHTSGAGYIAAESRTTPDGLGGFVFNRCKLTTGDAEKKSYLGRPWRRYSRVVYIDCWMGTQIRRRGWDNWRNPANEKTAWFGEYHSTGPGANPGQRVPWARQLSAAQAAAFRPQKFLAKPDGWDPVAGARSKLQ